MSRVMWGVCLAMTLAGCAVHRPAGVQPSADPEADWSSVLHDHVDDAGRIDFAALAQDPAVLHRYVAYVAAADPAGLGSREAVIAHHVNAYNALAMYNVITSGRRPESLAKFFVFQRFDVGGGRVMNLYDYENKMIRRLDEPRIHFVLNCMVVSCPRLPREPMRAATLERQLDAATREFMNDPRHVAVDHDALEVRLSKILAWYEPDYLVAAPTLVDYVNLYRDQPVPAGYTVRYLEYDWTLNGTDPSPGR